MTYQPGLTDAQLRAAPLSTALPDATASGTITANGGSVTLALNGQSGAAIHVSGTWVGTLQFEGTANDTDWMAINAVVAGSTTIATTTTANAVVRFTSAGLSQIRIKATAWASGTANISARAAIGTGGVFLNQMLPPGTNNIGGVDVVTLPALPAGANLLGSVRDAVQTGRVVRNFILNTFTAAPVADTMQSVEQWYNNAAVGATVSPAVVPTGKVLRLTGGRIETKSLATVGSVVMRVRCNVAGTAVIGSPLVASASCGSRAGATTVAMTGGHSLAEFTFGGQGLEIPAAAGVGFSLAGYGPTGALALQGVTRFEVWGYEYTA